MKHSICSAVFTAPNCFRTAIHNNGLSRFYSVCVKDIYDLESIYGSACNRNLYGNDYGNYPFTRAYNVVNREVIYYQRPYKNVRYQMFKRHCRFIMVECYTPYCRIDNMDVLLKEDQKEIKRFLKELTYFYPKNK